MVGRGSGLASRLSEFARDLDRCWVERRFSDLEPFLDSDVVFVAPGGGQRLEGRAKAIDSYRKFMAGAEVRSFEGRTRSITDRGEAAVVEYEWSIAWHKDGADFAEEGREILVLARRDRQWRLIWRTQIRS